MPNMPPTIIGDGIKFHVLHNKLLNSNHHIKQNNYSQHPTPTKCINPIDQSNMNGKNHSSSMVRESVLQLLYRCCRCFQMMCIVYLMFFYYYYSAAAYILIIISSPLLPLQLKNIVGGKTPDNQHQLYRMQQQVGLSPIPAPTHTQYPYNMYQYYTATTWDGSINNTIHPDVRMIHVIKLRLERDHRDLLYHVTGVELDNIIKSTRSFEGTVVKLQEKLKDLEEGVSHSTDRPPNMDWTEEGANGRTEPVHVGGDSLSQQLGRQCGEVSPRLYCFVVCTCVFNMKSR